MNEVKEEQYEYPPSPTYMPSSPRPSLQITQNAMEPEKDFILTFEALPELWNPRHKNYTNKYARNESLSKLLLILRKIKPESSIEDVKKKINTLRSNYRRDLKKVLMTENTADPYFPKSWGFTYLSFLRTIEKPLRVQKRLSMEDEDHTQQSIDSNQDESYPIPAPNFDQTTGNEALSPPYPKARKMTQESRNELIERTCKQILSNPRTSQQSYAILSCPIALEWAQTLEKLDPMQRLFAKKAINDVLFEAELGNLHKDSVKINDSNFFVARE